MSKTQISLKSYVVVARARSSLTLTPGTHLHVIFTDGTRISHIFAGTRLIRQADVDAPRGLFFECRCESENITAAVGQQAELADTVAGLIAVAGNAFVDHVMPELCFEATDGIERRDFFQSLLPEQIQLSTGTRQIPNHPVNEFMSSILLHKERDRLLRAVSHYRDTLQQWTLENRLRCILHLYFAVEAMTQIALRYEMERHNLDENNLARRYKIEPGTQGWRNHLLGHIRKVIIFHGDVDAYKQSKAVSDAFEHSYEDFNKLRVIAESIVVNVASHIRRALFELSNTPSTCRDILLDLPYDRPKGPSRLAHYFFGHLLGVGSELAADGNAYPILDFKYSLKPAIDTKTGDVQYTGPLTITPRLGKGLSLAIHRMEMWDGSSFVEPTERAEMLARAPLVNNVTMQSARPRTHGPFLLDSPHDAEMISLSGRFIVNCNSLRWILRSIMDHFDVVCSRRSTNLSLRVLARAIERTADTHVGDVKILVDLLREVENLEALRHTVMEGMLLSRIVEQDTPPEFTVLARSYRGKMVYLDQKELKEAVDKSSNICRDLYEWFNTQTQTGETEAVQPDQPMSPS